VVVLGDGNGIRVRVGGTTAPAQVAGADPPLVETPIVDEGSGRGRWPRQATKKES
jgi:hypothetical protein